MNNNLKKAFLEAAEKELEHLPEEENVFRTYTDDFEKRMKNLFESENKKEMKEMTKRRFSLKKTAIVVAAIILCLTITVGAVEIIQMKRAPELIPLLQEAIDNASVADGVAEFDEDYSKLDDLWKKADGDTKIILD